MKRKTGLTLVILNLIMALLAAKFFLCDQKLSVIQWLALNTCTPSIIIFALGFFLKNFWLMGFSATWMFFYGGGGLIVFQWSTQPQDLMPQIGHIFMTAAVIYIVCAAIKNKALKKFFLGALIGLILLIPTFLIQSRYQRENPELVKLLGFKENFGPPTQTNK